MRPISVGDLVYLYHDDVICDEQATIGIVVAWHPELRQYEVLIKEQFYWLKNEYLRKFK